MRLFTVQVTGFILKWNTFECYWFQWRKMDTCNKEKEFSVVVMHSLVLDFYSFSYFVLMEQNFSIWIFFLFVSVARSTLVSLLLSVIKIHFKVCVCKIGSD